MGGLRRKLSETLHKSIERGIEAYMRNAHNGNRIQAVIDSGRFADEKLKGVNEYDNKKQLMEKCISIAEKHRKANSVFMEFGVFQGESINYMARHTDSVIYGFDSFEGLPEDWRRGFRKRTFNVNKLPEVEQNVKLVKGWFNESLKNMNLSGIDPVFIHIDCDLYQSTVDVFEALHNNIRKNCIILFDEFYNYPGWKFGEYKAWNEFVEKYKIVYEYIGYVPNSEQLAVRILRIE